MPDAGSAARKGEAPAARVADGFCFAAVGDFIGPFRPEVPLNNAGFERVCDQLRSADVALGNQEGSIFDLEGFEGHRAAEHGGGYPLSDAVTAQDIRAMGVTVMSKANNHATDWGLEGLRATTRALNAAGIACAGSGPSRAAARAATYLETARGRVAVVSAASTFTPMSEAGNTEDHIRARPGISVLKVRPVVQVGPAEMTALDGLAQALGSSDAPDSWLRRGEGWLQFGEQQFRLGPTTGLVYEVDATDRQEVLRAIRSASQLADFVAFTLHAHESLSGSGCDSRPALFVQAMLRDAVDAGADLVTVTGPHGLRGVEIYRGKPLFHGLGSFFLQLADDRGPTRESARALGVEPQALTKPEAIARQFQLPAEWYDSVVARSHFDGGRLREVRLHPLVLERQPAPRLEGAPRPAPPADALRILERLREECLRWGTQLSIEGDEGVIHITPLPPSSRASTPASPPASPPAPADHADP